MPTKHPEVSENILMLEVEGFGERAADTGVPAWAVGRVGPIL